MIVSECTGAIFLNEKFKYNFVYFVDLKKDTTLEHRLLLLLLLFVTIVYLVEIEYLGF